MMMTINYKEAGVDISAGHEAVRRLKPLVEKTFSPHVCTKIGSFGALFDLKTLLKDFQHPLLVQSMDGVGTKTMIASRMQKFDTLGIDLVSATTNDIVVMGATPLTLLDYIAADKLHPHIIEQLIQGMAQACAAHGISLIGGETAEMPGTYYPKEHDLVGVVTGVVEKEQVISGKSIVPDDVVFGISSSGLHTNGYSLARKLFFETAGLDVGSYQSELGRTLGEVLLEPHLNYTKPILHCLRQGVHIKGMAHITGGGFLENIPRILPAGCRVDIQKNTWPIPPIFSMMEHLGHLETDEMFRTFNMGIGLVLIVDEAMSQRLIEKFQAFDEFDLYCIGQVCRSDHREVRIR